MTESHLLLVRHPETLANIEGRFVGRGDSPFTEEGTRQLTRLPEAIAAFRPDVVWSSPLERARVVAERACECAACPLVVDERLIELDFGQAEGLTFEEVERAGITFDYRTRARPVAPGGESRAEIEARTAGVVADILRSPGRHAVVTHGGVFRAALVRLLGLASADIWAFHIHNAQLATVRVVDGTGTLEEFVQG